MNTKEAWMIATAALALSLGLAGGRRAAAELPSEDQPAAARSAPAAQAQSVVDSWPSSAKKSAQALIEKYGQPDETQRGRLVWYGKGPWTSVVAFRNESKQTRMIAHMDYVQNTLRYEVPSNKVASLMKFDEGLSIDAAKGTLSVRGDSESSNILALNLADEIIKGSRDVASAKSFQRKTLLMSMAGKSSDYMQKLRFAKVPEQPAPRGY